MRFVRIIVPVIILLTIGGLVAKGFSRKTARDIDCERLQAPVTEIDNSIQTFYGHLLENSLTPKLAQELAVKVERLLPSLKAINPRESYIKKVFPFYVAEVSKFPASAKEWIKHPLSRDDYMRFKGGLKPEGSLGRAELELYCTNDEFYKQYRLD